MRSEEGNREGRAGEHMNLKISIGSQDFAFLREHNCFLVASDSWLCKEWELEDDQTLSADSAMQFQNSLLSVRIFLRMDRHGQGAFHHEYRC